LVGEEDYLHDALVGSKERRLLETSKEAVELGAVNALDGYTLAVKELSKFHGLGITNICRFKD
jgi:hypothetical protein